MKLQWTKVEDRWFANYGKIRAEVRAPNRDRAFSMYRWSVYTPAQRGGSGGTSSVASAKRCAEIEIDRFRRWLAAKDKGQPISD
jgi:hypothetical protein